MKHIIIGSGTIGKATGVFLHTNKEDVYFNDIKKAILLKIKSQGYKTTEIISNVDIYWICTAEWNVEEAIKQIKEPQKDSIIVVRSTTAPGTIKSIQEKYQNLNFVHNPEFLVQKSAIHDIFNPDRVIIGGSKQKAINTIKRMYKKMVNCPVITTDSTTSEMIKLTANCWLANQISYWNEIKIICDELKINPQELANAVTLDKRISNYGSIMLGKPFSGFCLPKDTKAMHNLFKNKKIKSELIDAIINVNESRGHKK